jgi:hypothetical protein
VTTVVLLLIYLNQSKTLITHYGYQLCATIVISNNNNTITAQAATLPKQQHHQEKLTSPVSKYDSRVCPPTGLLRYFGNENLVDREDS